MSGTQDQGPQTVEDARRLLAQPAPVQKSVQPSSDGMSVDQADALLKKSATGSGGLMKNFGAGVMQGTEFLQDWLTTPGVVANLSKHLFGTQSLSDPTENIAKQQGISPSQVTANTLPEQVARGAGAGVVGAGLGPESTALGVLKSIGQGALAGAGAGAGQFAGENLAPQGWEGVGGTLGGLAGGIAGGAATQMPRALMEGAAPTMTDAGRQSKVANTLTELSGGAPPTIEHAPIPNVPLDLAQSTNQPNIAAAVDELNQRDKNFQVQQRTAQNRGLTQAFTGSGGLEPVLSSGLDVTQAPEVNAANASVRYLGALQSANSVIKQEESRLWNVPDLQNVQIYSPWVTGHLERSLAGVSPGLRREIESGSVAPMLQDIRDMDGRTSLDAYNSVRSDILSNARAMQAQGNAKGAAAANLLGQKLLNAMEQAPGLRNNPPAWAAYQDARDFTRRKWDTLGFTPFQSALRPNRYGNLAVTPETAAGKLFNFSAGAETVPQGVNNINGLLDEVKNQWQANRTMIRDPQQVQATQNSLRQSVQDYVVSKALAASDSRATDLAGQANIIPNALRQWLGRNQKWLSDSGIFSSDQVDLLGRIQKTAQMLSRTENLQGSTNSRTYQRLMSGSLTDRLVARAFSRVAGTAAGALVGSHLGAPEIGAAAGYGASELASSLAGAPRQKALGLLDTALRDPGVARDILTNSTPSMWKRLAPTTQQTMRSALTSGELTYSPQGQGAPP